MRLVVTSTVSSRIPFVAAVLKEIVSGRRGRRGGAPLPDGGALPMPVDVNPALGQGPLGVEDADNFYP